MKIRLNDQPFTFTDELLPLLISGNHGAGSSLFTIHIMRQFVESGKKILFFTALPAAKQDFRNLLTDEQLNEAEFIEEGDQIEGKRIIVLMSGKEQAFTDAVHQIPDADERILLVKNMDQFSTELFNHVKGKTNLVLSGNLDETVFIDELKKLNFGAQVFFSKPQNWHVENFPNIEKYKGLMISKDQEGIVGLAKGQ